MKTELVDIVGAQNTLGEGVIWNHMSERLCWTDIKEAKFYSYNLNNANLNIASLPENLCAFGLTRTDDRFICAFSSGFYFYSVKTKEREIIQLIEDEWVGSRMNDGRMDRKGRFWAGSMIEDPIRQPPGGAALYSLSGTNVKKHFDDVSISNGIAWSPDNKIMYFADSPKHKIYAFDYDIDQGVISNRRDFATLPSGAFPDGATIDEEGCLWIALWGAGEVGRFSPQGEILHKINIAARQPTCVSFAGEDLNYLCVTTAKEGLSQETLHSEPHSGDLFIYETDARGLQETLFDEEFH